MKNRRIFSGVFYTLLVSILSIQPVLAFDEFFFSGNDIFHYNPDEICLTTNDTDVNLSGDGNLERILNYLVSQGMTLQGAAGAAGNIQVESAFNPKNVQNDYEDNEDNVDINGGGDAKAAPRLPNGDVDASKMYKPIDDIGFGISQWTNGGTPEHPETGWIEGRPDRQTFLYQMAVDQKRDIADLGLQLDFLWSELEGNYKTSTLDKIKNITDVREAAKIYMINYEGPLDQSAAAQNGRADKAEAIYNRYKNRVTGATADTNDISGGNATGNPKPYKNPVINDYSAAPAIIQDEDGAYHVFTTGFRHYTSKNLVDWRLKQDRDSSWIKGGYPGWVNNDHWVPDIAKTGDTYTFVYTSGSPKRIGIGTSSSPTPPFDKSGDGVLVPPVSDYATIDPFLLDDGGGRYVLYFGSNKYDKGIQAIEYRLVNGELRKVSGPRTAMKGDYDGAGFYTNEAAYVIKRDNYYYLFYSAGTPSRGVYEIRVARSERAIGGYEKPANHKPILTSGNGFVAPGQNSVITDGGGRDWIVYHAVSQASANRGQYDDRRMMIDPIEWVNGWPKVRDGHPSKGLQRDGPTPGIGSSSSTDEECASDGTGDINTDQSANFGTVTFPLKGNKGVVNNSEIFANGTTSQGGHPYIAYDIYADAGTEVRAFADGIVTYVHPDSSLGKGVSIHNEKSGLTVYYTHMSRVDVSEGARISPGDTLGIIASVNDYPDVNVDHLHIDASTDRIRQGCSRNSCSIQDHFRDIGRDLYQTYQKLPDDN